MDVKTLCLGLRTEGDQTGYAIKQRFEEGFNHFFGAGFGSIYPALAELTRQGLVSCRSVEQDKRPDKKVYSLTPAGERVLIDELMETPPRHKVRSEFLVLMYFAHLLPPEQVGRIIDEMAGQFEPLLAECTRRLESATVDDDGAPLTPGMRFAAGFGRAVLSAALGHIREHRDQLVRELAENNGEAQEPLAAAE